MVVRLDQSYVVDGKKEVTLNATVGQGQKGHTEMFLDGKLLPCKAEQACRLGTGNSLAGKKLRIVSVVTDTNPMTNATSVTYDLGGGKEDRSYVLAFTVAKERETVDYVATFKFI
jgi:hypothetical protein